jgi:hypothetical protein
VGEQLLMVLCSLSDLLAQQDMPLLEQLHAGTVDLLLGEQMQQVIDSAAVV